MTKEEYKELRKKLGTQEAAALLVGVSMNTISRRELGLLPITPESWHAIVHVVNCLYASATPRTPTRMRG